MINSFFEKTKLDFKGFRKFVLLNTFAILSIFSGYLIIITIVDKSVKLEFLGVTAYIILTIYFLFFYIFVNVSHFLFLKELKIGKTIKKTVNLVFGKKYYGILLGSFLLFLIFYLVYLIIALIMSLLVFNTQEAYLTYSGIFEIFINGIMFLFVYFLIFFNRIYFRSITEKK